MNQNLLIRYILGLLEIIIKNYSYESIFNYLKIDLLDIDKEDIFKLEKYCLKYGIKNNKFKKDFIYGINEKNKEEINYLNELRKKIINPIIDLEEKINKKQKVENIIKEIYFYLNKENIEEKINIKINMLEANKLFDIANEYKISYEITMNIFDEIVNIFNGEEISLNNFLKIFKTALKNSELGKIPSSQDEIIVGDIDRSRTHKVKAIFILGLNDGAFPSVNKDEGFFNDKDRIVLKEFGIEMAKNTLENIYDDNFNIYKAFTTAEEKIFLSYCQTDIDGKPLRPSTLIYKIKKIFPKLEEKNDIFEKNDLFVNEKNIYENLILNINNLNKEEIIKNKQANKKIFLLYSGFNNFFVIFKCICRIRFYIFHTCGLRFQNSTGKV